MIGGEAKRIFDMIAAEAAAVGIKYAKEACKAFLKNVGKVERGPRPPIPREWVKQALIRQGMRCNICRRPLALDEAAGDHVEPWAEGGAHASKNIAAVHDAKFGGTCNQEKGSRGLIKESKRQGRLMTEMLPGDEG